MRKSSRVREALYEWSEKGPWPNEVQVLIRENGNQIQLGILKTGGFRFRLERDGVMRRRARYLKSVEVMKALESRETEHER